MSVERIAKRYAKSLLELSAEHKVTEQVYADMQSFAAVCAANREFLMVLKSPIILHSKKATILKAIFADKVQSLTAYFFEIVTRKNREMYLPDIAVEFTKLYNAKMGLQEATITTAVPLTDGMRKDVEQLVKEITGKQPILKEKVKTELIGGFLLQMGDRQLDESISGKLSELRIKFQKETI